MRLSNRERTSQRPSPKLSTNGFPTGHAYCTVRMSVPMTLQSSFDNPFSHSRTGSLPASVLKKTTLSGRSAFIRKVVYQKRYVCQMEKFLIHGKSSSPAGGRLKLRRL